MKPEAPNLFLGLMEIFSILLPGAVCTYLLKDDLAPLFLGARYGRFGEAEGWIVFLFASYLLGHIVFLLGAWLLDDFVYDPIRNATADRQMERLADGGRISPLVARMLARWLVKEATDRALRLAVQIKNHALEPLGDASAVNAFQWSKARLTLKHKDAMATVERFEADSKFFRSLVIVLAALVPWALWNERPALAGCAVGLLVLAFWRYMDQRLKATSHAYSYIITIEAQDRHGYRAAGRPAEPSHAGGVVFRRKREKVEFLLVRAKSAPEEWVLPKGHIEAGERPAVAAVREVMEESGVWARVESELPMVSFSAKGQTVAVQYFVMESLLECEPAELRAHAWFPPDEAQQQATHPETQELLRLARGYSKGRDPSR